MPENFKRLLAHKLGNLVMLARNPVELLDEPDLPSDQREQLRHMLIDSLENMEQVCRDLTDLGRTEELDEEPLQAYQPGLSIQQVIQQAQEDIDSSKYTLRYIEASPLPGELVGHPELFERAVERLIENAVKFMPEGGTIDIVAQMEDKKLVVHVTDHGLGIPEQYHERIFEPFFRVKDRITTHLPGLGLGLSVAYAIAEAHGGTITVTSEPGKGSTFNLYFPLNHAG